MILISDSQLNLFHSILDKYLNKTVFPEKDNWKKLSNNEIWLKIIAQVIVVGSSGPADKFRNEEKIRKNVDYSFLLTINVENELTTIINKALRDVGTRYASKDKEKCKKTKALVKNFEVLRKYKDGPKEMLESVCKFDGEDIGKAKYLMNMFSFFRNKSARDFLMELGIITNTMALDIRVQNVFSKAGIIFPKGFETKEKLYDEIEADILSKICKPLNIQGVQLDRIVYQNYDQIIKELS